MSGVTEMEEYGRKRHQEVLGLIDSLSDTTSSDGASSVRTILILGEQNNDFGQGQQDVFGIL
jgi:hypothetical protein